MRPLIFILALGMLEIAHVGAALAQEVDALPTCSSQGLQRAVAMVPAGQTAAQFRELLRSGALFPVGTAVNVLRPEELPTLRNPQQLQDRMNVTLLNLIQQGIRIDGSVPVLIELAEDGSVADVHPKTGNARIDRQFARTWRTARFEPYVVDGCRVKGWVQLEMAFSTDWSLAERLQSLDIRPLTP